jgi:four helix bundle protein
VYRLAVEFAAWVGELIDEGPLKSRKISAVKHLDDSSRSIVNHIAEGNGKRSRPDRCRFFDISRGAALECSSCLDVLVARKRLQTDEVAEGKAMIVRIVSMLSKLIEKLLGPGSLAEQKTRSVSSRSRVRRA